MKTLRDYLQEGNGITITQKKEHEVTNPIKLVGDLNVIIDECMREMVGTTIQFCFDDDEKEDGRIWWVNIEVNWEGVVDSFTINNEEHQLSGENDGQEIFDILNGLTI